ncbi:MAG TPA: DUF1772 domain-containing protein [Pyrinomonadaceae bacterium]|nr:DUF1772 domain-containing protein [Pyrinomonadaceae bacterium]
MKQQFSIAQILLWLFVITLGITLGGGLYETLVTMPLWSASPPDSVIDYYRHNSANPQFALNQGGRFWIYFTPLLGLLSIATLLSGFKTRPEHRRWRIAGTVFALTVVVVTFAWFIPNIIKLMSEAVLAMNTDELTNLTDNWVRLNWARAFLYSAAWIAALRALSIPPKTGSGI